MTELQFYKIDIRAKLPRFATEESACFDFYCLLPEGLEFIYLHEGEQLVLGCGLIPIIPRGHSIRIHPRSGLAFNNNITLVNCEGIIDSDYADEIKFKLHRIVDDFDANIEPIKINNGDRIAQGELLENQPTLIKEIHDRPHFRGTRTGGFGSTGKK